MKGWFGRASDCSAILGLNPGHKLPREQSGTGQKQPHTGGTHIKSLSMNSMALVRYSWTPQWGNWNLPVNLTYLQCILVDADLPRVLPLQDPLSTGAQNISQCLKSLSYSHSHFIGKETGLPMTMCDLANITCNRVGTETGNSFCLQILCSVKHIIQLLSNSLCLLHFLL